MSKMRKKYFIRLFSRIVIFIISLIMCFKPHFYGILDGMNFFDKFHILHLLWLVWIFDMFMQIIPVKNELALGSQKLFAHRFQPAPRKINQKYISKNIKKNNVSAYKVFFIWTLLTIGIGILYYFKVINKTWLLMISMFFYVCDLICVLIWCPFRLIMKNKCCTTCRIFNWDHLMMFSPLIFCGGFFSISLVIMAFLTWLVWELSILIYPERFSEMTNGALRCSNCTDKLCTQYCKKKIDTINKN